MSHEKALFTARLVGWVDSPAGAIEVRFTSTRPSGITLVVERRENASPYWLWIVQGSEKRCIGLTPKAELELLLDRIVAKQDGLSLMSYLSASGDFGDVADTTIIAWEQFE